MIIEHICVGSMDTALHSFSVTAGTSHSLTLSAGEYYLGGSVVFVLPNPVEIVIPAVTETTHFQLWIAKAGIEVLTRLGNEFFEDVAEPIDMLAWFTLTPEAQDLRLTELNVRKVVAADGN